MADYRNAATRSGQAVGVYNFGDGYFWGRVRGVQQIATVAGDPLRVGAEVVRQGGDLLGQDEELVGGTGYRSFQAGPTVEYGVGSRLQLLAGAGIRGDNLPDTPDLFPYLGVELVFLPLKRE